MTVDLTGKQRKRLRAIGQSLQAGVHVGKAGVTDAVLAELAEKLDRHELVKVRLGGQLPPAARKEFTADLAERLEAAVAGQIGHTALLYRPNPDLEPDRRVRLE